MNIIHNPISRSGYGQLTVGHHVPAHRASLIPGMREIAQLIRALSRLHTRSILIIRLGNYTTKYTLKTKTLSLFLAAE